jgi:hypothetical protein
VALVLGVGVVLVLLVLASVSLVDSINTAGGTRTVPSENLTQILATILGGIVGALGAYLGRAGMQRRGAAPDDEGPVEWEPMIPPSSMTPTDPFGGWPLARPVPSDERTPAHGIPRVERAESGEPIGP